MQLQQQVVDIMAHSAVDADHICGRLAGLLRQLLDTAPAPENTGAAPQPSTVDNSVMMAAPPASNAEGADWPFGIHVDTVTNDLPFINNQATLPGLGGLETPGTVPNYAATLAATSSEQDQLLSAFFGAPGESNETNLLGTLWNHDAFQDFNDFLDSSIDMGFSGQDDSTFRL